MLPSTIRRVALLALAGLLLCSMAPAEDKAKFHLATFSADVTPPAGHPLLAGASRVPGAVKIDDPLSAVGFVLIGGEKPVVVCSIDWCEIRNDAYDRWRDALAEAAGTTRDRVLVTSIHQHDAPLPDLTAQRILEEHGATSKVIDPEFHEQCVKRTAQALTEGLKKAQPITHLGLGLGKVEQVASNRRFTNKAGVLSFDRSSMSGGKIEEAAADEGQIDPFLRTISFWNGEQAVCALHAYAVHPMSNWGTGNVTCDFPGLARRRRQADDPAIHQIYVSGASGDVTAGKYNDGNLANRPVLADRLYKGMVAAWQATKRVPLEKLDFRSAQMLFTPRDTPGFTIPEMTATLKHELTNKQSLAALGLSARKRFDAKQPVDLPVLDFGPAQIVLLPGESYVHFQLLAQKLRPDSFVLTMGFGESAAGYVAPDKAWDENDGNLALWCWNAPRTGEAVVTEALRKALNAKNSDGEKKADGAAKPTDRTDNVAADRADKDYGAELPKIAPKSPAESMKAIRLKAPFHAELVASEPLIRSPMGMDFDEFGRAFVVELPEYNQYANPRPQGTGAIKRLEDTDGDGRFDKATVYVDGLNYPTAVACWNGGILVGVAPDILFCKDTDGDGKADIRKQIYTGFGQDKAGEGMLNSFRWRFDNRFYIPCGLDGGEVAAPPEAPYTKQVVPEVAKPINIRGQHLLLDPLGMTISATSGGGQHGMCLDDWNLLRFVCGNSEPVNLIMYDGRYLARNPYLQAPAAAINVAPDGKFTKLMRISGVEPWRVLRTRLRNKGIIPGSDEGGTPSGFFTAATGITVYRGNAWPEEYRGQIFVGEVANNLVYRARLIENGVGRTAERADTEAEFLASTDNWFRPVQFANAPDGTLYVLDMYRELIEGAAFLAPTILKHMDPGAGADRGRIYRIAPEGFKFQPAPRLGDMPTAELVKLFEHPNAWHRDTASRLIYQRQDKSAVAPLRKLAAESASPLARVMALYSLQGLSALEPSLVASSVKAQLPEARQHALRLAESFTDHADVERAVLSLAADPNVRVRYQAAFTLGAFPSAAATQALARLAARDGADSWMQLAILSSVGSRRGEFLAALVAEEKARSQAHAKALLAAVVSQIGAAQAPAELAALAKQIDTLAATTETEPLAAELVRSLIAKQPVAPERFAGAGGERMRKILTDVLSGAIATARDTAREPAERAAAVRLLSSAPLADTRELFATLLESQQPQPVQLAALETLARLEAAETPELILAAWPAQSPQLRATSIETLFTRPAWINAFLAAVEQGTVSRADLDPSRIALLQKHQDGTIRARAAKLFAGAPLARRQQVVDAYQSALEIKGDIERGRAHFRKVCAACHKLEGFGESIGADLNAIRDRGAAAVVLNILDPNREVKPQFLSYVAVLDSGRTLSGMIAAETANSLTFRKADNTTETVLRVNIDELKSTGLSFMPEGLEKQLDPDAMADLVAYLNSIK